MHIPSNDFFFFYNLDYKKERRLLISSNLPLFFKTYNFPRNDYFISLSISSNSGPIFKL